MTDPDFTIRSLFDTPMKRAGAAKDFGVGLFASAVMIAAAWVLA